MAFDPTKPVELSPLDAGEIRNQLNALKALIDAQAAQIVALQNDVANKATKPTAGELDPGYSDPPTYADLMSIQGFINDLVQQLEN
jgi:hypothetical protein